MSNLIHRSWKDVFFDALAILIFLLLYGAWCLKYFASPAESLGWVELGLFILAVLTTDFLSGCIHWAADTWGSKDWPIVGNHLIGPFREHHVDPQAITQHNFVETNGENCFIAIPFVIGGIVCLNHGAENGSFYLASISLAGLATNQIHKWAHQEERPALVTFLQNARIILSPRAHGVHHTPPFENDYCITTGWMNPILRHLRFFRILESFITFLTRVPPREEDLSLQKD